MDFAYFTPVVLFLQTGAWTHELLLYPPLLWIHTLYRCLLLFMVFLMQEVALNFNVSSVKWPCFRTDAILRTVNTSCLNRALRSIDEILQNDAHLRIVRLVLKPQLRDLIAKPLQSLRSTHAHTRQTIGFLGGSHFSESLLQVSRIAPQCFLDARNGPAVQHVHQHVD